MAASLEERVRARIQEAKEHDPAALSTDQSALLLIATMGGSMYVRPDGTVLTEVRDSGEGLVEELDPKNRCAGLVNGTKKYPELAAFLPQRSANSKACIACAGTGWLTLRKQSIVCAECSGLGWSDAA